MSLNHNRSDSAYRISIRRRRTGKYPTLLNEFENDIFLGGLCSSQNNFSLWKKAPLVKKSGAYPDNNTRTSLKTIFLNSLTFFEPQAYNSSFLESLNNFNDQITIRLNQGKLNRLNFIQKRRSKIQPLLRITSQKIYSLNKFQIALCFSKILQPSILFNDESVSNLSGKLYNSMYDNGQNKSDLETQTTSLGFLPGAEQWGGTQEGETQFLNDNVFAKSNQKINDISFNPMTSQYLVGVDNMKPQMEPDNYNLRKDWYMKTGFFQHIAWNMKHKILSQFSNIELLFDLNSLPIKNCDNFVIKPSQLASYQKKPDFSITNDRDSDKIEKQGSNIMPFLTKAKISDQLIPDNLPMSVNSLQTNTAPNSDFLLMSRIKETRSKNHNFFINHKNLKSILPNNFFKIAQKPLFWKPYNYKFCQNSSLIIYGGSWYYENLAFPYSIFNRVPVTELLYRNKDTLPPIYFNNGSTYKKNFALSEKLQKELESNIGIYSLAHKLSTIGFHNGYAECDIYPFKYNDSYRYNFQNMNLSNSHLRLDVSRSDGSSNGVIPKSFFTEQDFIKFSNLASRPLLPQAPSVAKEGASRFSPKKKTEAHSAIHFSNFRKFLDFQNPIFSKIYAPVFQPQGLNLISFLYNSFLNVVPDSILNSPSTSSFGSFSGMKETGLNFKNRNPFSTINQSPDYLKNFKKIDKTYPISNFPGFSLDENFQANTKKRKMFNRLYTQLPVNGLHANIYPWITQNADSRWSKSSDLFNQLTNVSNLDSAAKTVLVSDSMTLPKKLPLHDQNLLRKNENSPLYFTEKPSYIKKPLIFFSSFRHLPYFFMSETLSIKDVTFPETNLSLFPCFSMSDSTCREAKSEYLRCNQKNNVPSYINFSIPEYSLFNQNVLKQNQKKKIVEPWKGYLQYKSFSLKALSTFVKKTIGYETSWFFKKSKNWFISKEKFYQTTNLTPIQSNRWKIFPPLFQPFTFRFTDLNLPRSWSSEIFTSMFKTTQTPFISWKKKLKQKNKEKLSQVTPLGFLPGAEQGGGSGALFQTEKWNVIPKNFFRFPIPFYFSDFFNLSAFVLPGKELYNNQLMNSLKQTHISNNHPYLRTINSMAASRAEKQEQPNMPMLYENNQSNVKSFPLIDNSLNNKNTEFYESAFALADFSTIDKSKQIWSNNQKFEKKHRKTNFNETLKSQDSKIIVYGEKPLLKNRTVHGPPLKNQKESISLPNYLKNITNQNYQNLCPNNLNEFYFVFWILFNKTLFIYLSLHYLRKFISFLGTEYIRNLFKIFVTMKFIDGNILSIIKTFQDFNFQLNQQNVIDIKVNKQLKNIKRN